MKRKLSKVSVLLPMLVILAVLMVACGDAPQEAIPRQRRLYSSPQQTMPRM